MRRTAAARARDIEAIRNRLIDDIALAQRVKHHPVPFSGQIWLQKAIALNPSESWIYTDMSRALTFNGRPADGLAFLDSALRVDPGWDPYRYYLQGLAYFSQDRFADAATSLEKIDLQSDWFWPQFYGLQVLLSAYGHLGRDADGAAEKSIQGGQS